MIKPGPKNLITDIDGILVGNAEDMSVRTGTTVILPDEPVVAAVDVRGGAPGSRETDALDPTCLVEKIHGLFLSGGSVFGLAAGDGMVSWLSQRGRGLDMGMMSIPVVPGVILFDLANGGDKSWGDTAPYRRLAIKACDSASAKFSLGNAGAGYGAVAGALKGGLGSVSAVTESGLQVGAMIAANPVGSVVVPGQSAFWAGALEQQGELGGLGWQGDPVNSASGDMVMGFPSDAKVAPQIGGNTTIGIVATNAKLDRAQAQRVAMMAQDGLARAVRPAHMPYDGDTIFAISTGTWPLPEPSAMAIAEIGAIAADCAARALARGVYEAESLGGYTSYRARYRPNNR